METLQKSVKSRLLIPVLALMAIGMALIWPVGVFRDELISRTAADYSANTGPIGPVLALQEFVPRYGRIKTIGIDIGKEKGNDTGVVVWHFYDAGLVEFASFETAVSDMKDGELTDIPVNLRLVPGQHYYIGVDCRDYEGNGPVLHYRSLAGNGPKENIHFYQGPVLIEDASANIRYTYEIPLKWYQVLFYYSVVVLIGMAVLYLSIIIGRKDTD